MTDDRKHGCYSCNGEYDDAGYGMWMCIDGSLYGPCESELCGGVCELYGSCTCACHDPI